jgi:serine/threonine protein phosphatase PrpC
MIGHYHMSLIGSSHLFEKNGVCQDSSDVRILRNGWVIGVIADGLGSAKHSDIGSSLAVSAVIEFVEKNMIDIWHEESLISLLRIAYHSAFKKIKDKAATDGYPINDYDTTLTCVIYNGTNVIFGHVGDGGIIALSPYGDFSILTAAQKGEEFYQVTPLRSTPDNWLFGTSIDSVCALLMLTDGVYDVACPWLIDKKEQRIYINYVRPFMDRNILSFKTVADFENAKKEIEDFFSGEHSKQITDDKTILGIINIDVMPEVKSDDYYTEPDWERLSREHREKLYGRTDTVVNVKTNKVEEFEDSESITSPNDSADSKSESPVNVAQKMQPPTSAEKKPTEEVEKKKGGIFSRFGKKD